MRKFTRTLAFLQQLLDNDRLAEKAARIIDALFVVRSPRLSDLAQQMPGSEAANYKMIQRFLNQVDLRGLLWRLLPADAPFVIGDPTEMPRPQAHKTAYVGKLKDGKTRGFWVLMLATPFRGRALPCGFVTYSSDTIAQTATSRNMFHWQAFDQIKQLLGDRPLVLDREFSYLEQLHYCTHTGINFVIRLNLGRRSPKFSDATGRRVQPEVSLGKDMVYYQLRYKDRVPVNLFGIWTPGHAKPLWIMSNLAPEQAWHIYRERMKIEESFRDLKSLLGLDRLMNKSQHYLEQMICLVLIAYAIGLLLGEALRDELYGPPPPPDAGQKNRKLPPTDRKWRQFSGLFILLKRKFTLSATRRRQLRSLVLAAWQQLILPPVRTHV